MSYERRLGYMVFGGIFTLICVIGINSISTEAIDVDDIDVSRFDTIICQRIIIADVGNRAGMIFSAADGVPLMNFVKNGNESVLTLMGESTSSDGRTVPPSILVGELGKKHTLILPEGITNLLQ